jgi:branched-chain amino acid transport system substrate-binding protein
MPLDGEKVKQGFEKIKLDATRLKELGASGLMPELAFSEQYHGGIDSQIFQQWDGKKWTKISDWIAPYDDVVRTQIAKSVAEYEKESNAKN